MIYLTQLIYVQAGCEADFEQFEDVVLPRLGIHGGELVLRLRPGATSKLAGTHEVPFELHIVRFDTEAGLAAYAQDEVRRQVLHLKERSVRTTLLIKGARVES